MGGISADAFIILATLVVAYSKPRYSCPSEK
jgi:hypothetical protein